MNDAVSAQQDRIPETRSPRIGLLSAWASRLGGGVFEAVVAHAHMIAELGFEPIVIALEDEHCAADRERFGAFEVRTFPVVGPGIVGFAPQLLPALCDARLDLLHLHGIWMYLSRAGARWGIDRTALRDLAARHARSMDTLARHAEEALGAPAL